MVATAVRTDGTTLPWAMRSRNFTYVGEIPVRYTTTNDRYVVFADLLFDALAPATPERHRAMVRIENVGPDSDPVKLRQIADYLKSKNVPFSFGFYPRYVDPYAYYERGPELCLSRSPELVSGVKYLIEKGGTMVLYGLTHQLDRTKNPFSGASGDDYEFYLASVDATNSVVLSGPVPNDSEQWSMDRMGSAIAEVTAMGLPVPVIFEFPRYAASVPAYRAAKKYFAARYDRGLYFAGTLRGGEPDYQHYVSQSFPYEVTDLYGSRVVPENLGGYSPNAWFNEPPHLVANLLDAARGNLVVRDGFASFYHQWYSDLPILQQLVEGLQGMGYTFVSAAEVAGVTQGAPNARTTVSTTQN